MITNINTDDVKRLLFTIAMRTSFTNLLVGEDAQQGAVHDLLVAERLQRLVHAVRQTHVELDGVLLLAQVHRLALQLKVTPQTARDVVLQLAGRQMAEDGLQLLENVDVVLFDRLVAATLLQLLLLLFFAAAFAVRFQFLLAVEILVEVDGGAVRYQHAATQTLDHEQLLQHRVHVARRAGVLQAHETPRRPRAHRRQVLPLRQRFRVLV